MRASPTFQVSPPFGEVMAMDGVGVGVCVGLGAGVGVGVEVGVGVGVGMGLGVGVVVVGSVIANTFSLVSFRPGWGYSKILIL